MRQLAQRIVDVTAAGDEAATLSLYASNVQSTEVGAPPTSGTEALRRKFANWNKRVSRSTWRARNVWIGGNTIIIEWKGHLTLAESGRTVDFDEIAVHEVEQGKIVRERYYYDRSLLQP
jgi:ketosteroid isomerase-like protein